MLLVIGESHTVFWGRNRYGHYPQVKCVIVTGGLAFNLSTESGEVGKHGKTIIEIINSNPGYSAILLCFGEIDSRMHILKQAIKQSTSLSQQVSVVANRYLNFINILRSLVNVPIFIWGPIATCPQFGAYPKSDPPFLCIGSETERNAITIMLNRALSEGLKKQNNCFHFTMLDKLISPDLLTDTSYYIDDIHLGFKATEYAVAEFNRIALEHDLNLPNYFDPIGSFINSRTTLSDISNTCRIVHISSNSTESVPTKIIRENMKELQIFCTMVEDQPTVAIDIGYSAYVKAPRCDSWI